MTDDTTQRVLSLVDFLAAFDAQKNPPFMTLRPIGCSGLTVPTSPTFRGCG